MAPSKKSNLLKRPAKKKNGVVKTVLQKKSKPPAQKKLISAKVPAPKKRVPAAKKKPAAKPASQKVKKVIKPVRPSASAVVVKSAERKSRLSARAVPKMAFLPKADVLKPTVKKRTAVKVSKIRKVDALFSEPLRESQAASPIKPSFFKEVQGELPAGYGDHFIALMICSPYQLYAYWEIQKPREEEALRSLGGGWDYVKSILRVYNLTQDAAGTRFFDLELSGGADRWFIDAEPAQSYRVEIGLRHADGRFKMLARSNDVTTPRAAMSEILDEEWMGIDFERMYALSGGFEPGQHSSAMLQKLMADRLRSGDTSGSGSGMMSSGTLVQKKKRDFWFTLNCELIVYGATAPDAQVTMNGQSVQLRPDGTFTLRYALPDGKMRLEAKAVSSDAVEERTITPTVQRNTERLEPVIRRNRGRG